MGKITFLINRVIKEFETELKREKNSFKDTEAIPLITHRRKGKDNDICIRKKYKGKIHEKTIKEKEYDSVTGRFILHMQMKNDLSFERIGIKRLSAITEKILKKEKTVLSAVFLMTLDSDGNYSLIRNDIRGEKKK